MIIIRNKEEQRLVQLLREVSEPGAVAKQLELQKDIEKLKIEKARREEEFEKRERELKHMIGLEKKRQEFEIEAAKTKAALDVREENLKHAQKQFEEHLKFNTERLSANETTLKDLLKIVTDRLPNVNVEVKRR